MGPEGAVNILYRRELAPDAPRAARAEKVAEYISNFANPYIAARRGYVDDIIEPSETRAKLIAAFQLLEKKRVVAAAQEARQHTSLDRCACSSPTAAKSPSASSGPAATSRSRRSPCIPTRTDGPRTSRWPTTPCVSGRRRPEESYLSVPALLEAARKSGADLVHPGYGFLAENAAFARACREAGLTFVGPSPERWRPWGPRPGAASSCAGRACPSCPGRRRPAENAASWRDSPAEAGYPILLKASAGGGGKGMRRVDREAELEAAFARVTAEAGASFGDGAIYAEKLIERPRHVEVQVDRRHARATSPRSASASAASSAATRKSSKSARRRSSDEALRAAPLRGRPRGGAGRRTTCPAGRSSSCSRPTEPSTSSR